ncbi:MAG: CoA transferase [Proteobacteria bacterium]|nr:CoA transferase [Pseudomonadota bacterium]
MPGALAGLRVVEGSAFVAAPLGGMTLAQLGADVIRFDQIGGGLDYRRWPVTKDGRSLYWPGLNKGKRSIAVDLRNPRAQELLGALITRPGPDAGVFLTNLPARGWCGYDALQAKRADLIMVLIQGHHDGATAVDYTVNSAVGMPFVTGPVGADGPINHVLPAWDMITGVSAALSVVTAERHRTRTGAGQLIKIALSDIAMAMVSHVGHIAEVQINEADRPRYGNDLYGAYGRDFATRDGKRIMLAVITARQWQGLLDATGIADQAAAIERELKLDFRREGDRFQARERLHALVGPWIAARTLAEVGRAFDQNGQLWGPYQTFREMVETDPRCSTANPMFAEIEQPGLGRWLVPGSPLDFTQLGRVPVTRAPQLGEHTDEILSGLLGLPDHDIAQLHDAKVVAGPEAR